MKKNRPEPKPRPGVSAGDHIYFRHEDGPDHARVLACGRHGVTVHHGGERRKVRWDDVLGHRQRTRPNYRVVDRGEDGAIAEDDKGRRVFLAGDLPDGRGDEREEQMSELKKSIVMLKAIKNAPGLSLQETTDSRGHAVKRWKKTGADVKKERGGGAKDRKGDFDTHNVKPGDGVSFHHEGDQHNGEVVATGKDGATVQHAETGEHHRVFWHEVANHEPRGQEPEKPDYDERREGETDKEYAKRVVDKTESPDSLPEDHGRYFNTGDSTHVPIENLHSTKSDEENQQGGDNGPKRMLAAYHGALGKRDPITVMPHAEKDGHFEVVDGNGTYTSAKKLGWKGLPANVVSRKEGLGIKAEETAKDLFDKEEIAHLPKSPAQPVGRDDKDKLYELSSEAYTAMTQQLKGVAKALNLENMKGGMDDVDWNKKGGMLFIAPLKGEERATEKVEADYGGDWSKLRDVVRASIAVDSMGELKDTLDHLKKNGLELAGVPKNRFAKPTPEGYRDILLNVKFPNGAIGELQLHVKPMLEAKKEGHKHYEVTRSLQGEYNSDEPTDKWSDEDHTKFYEAKKAQQRIYSQAWEKATGAAEVLNKSFGYSKMIMLVRFPRVSK